MQTIEDERREISWQSTAVEISLNTTTVLTQDLWDALDALDAVPEAQHTEWYRRLEEAADVATQVMLLDKGVITEQ